MKARHLLVSACLSFSVMTAHAADVKSGASALSEDIPRAAMDLQKTISALGLNITPCATPDPVGADPLICIDPVKAICGSQNENERSERELRIALFKVSFLGKVYSQLRQKLGQDPSQWLQNGLKNSDSKVATERTLEFSAMSLEVTEKLLFELFKDKGWSKESLGKLVDQAKTIELSKIQPDDTIHPNRMKILSSAPLLTPDVFRGLPLEERKRAQLSMVTACGLDGLSNNAFATIPSATPQTDIELGMALDAGKPAVFIICPGLLLQAALNDAGPDSIVYVVGHELGHLLQPLSQVKGTRKIESPEDRRKVADAEKAYEKAVDDAEIACPKLKGCFVRKDFFSDNLYLNSCDVGRVTQECGAAIQVAAKARQDLIDRLTTPPGKTDRDRAFLSCLKKNDLNEMNNGREQIVAYLKQTQPQTSKSFAVSLLVSQQVENKKRELDDFEKKWGRKPDSIDLHQGELVADYWGSQVLSEIMKDIPDVSSRKARLSSNFSAFCQDATAQSKDNDIEGHPPFGYRFQRILSNPAIRSSLGCKSPSPRVWCDR